MPIPNLIFRLWVNDSHAKLNYMYADGICQRLSNSVIGKTGTSRSNMDVRYA